MPPVCVDASLVLTLLLPGEARAPVSALWSQWTESNTSPFGPPLLYIEVPSVLRESVYFGRISASEGDIAFQTFCQFGIGISRRDDLHILAWDLAKAFNRPKVYDSMYLAAAQAEGCELWTLDRRLVNAVNLPWVRWAGAIQG